MGIEAEVASAEGHWEVDGDKDRMIGEGGAGDDGDGTTDGAVTNPEAVIRMEVEGG